MEAQHTPTPSYICFSGEQNKCRYSCSNIQTSFYTSVSASCQIYEPPRSFNILLLFSKVLCDSKPALTTWLQGDVAQISSSSLFPANEVKNRPEKQTGERRGGGGRPSAKSEQTVFISAANCVISPFQTEATQAYQVARQKPEPSLRYAASAVN